MKRLAKGEEAFYLGVQAGEMVALPLATVRERPAPPPKGLASLLAVLAR